MRAPILVVLVAATPAAADLFDPTQAPMQEGALGRKESARSAGAFIIDERPLNLTGTLPLAPARTLCKAIIAHGWISRGACGPCLVLERLAPGEHDRGMVNRCFATR